jgi:hypothetical protein
MPSETAGRASRSLAILALVVAVSLTVVLGLMLPGLGLVLGVGLALTAYRDERRIRTALVGLGIVVTAIAVLAAILVAAPGGTSLERDEPVLVRETGR